MRLKEIKYRNQQTKPPRSYKKKSLKALLPMSNRGKPVCLQVVHEVVSTSVERLCEECGCQLLRKSVDMGLLCCSGYMLEKQWPQFTLFFNTYLGISK